jgi:membrane associated rhomboid family serine protease
MDDSQTNMYILYGFIGINCGVFAYTSYVKEQARQGNMQPFTKFYRNFTLNLHSVLDEHRYWTLLTNTFTHGGFMHLLGNMFSLFFMGRLVAQTPGIGPLAFVTLAIGSGLAGSAGYLYQRWLKTQGSRMRDNRHGLGFSGAVMGVGTAAACMYPKVTFLIYGIVPMPLWALMAGYMVYDGFYLNSDRNTGTAHAGHIGGAAFGALYYFLKLRRGIFV